MPIEGSLSHELQDAINVAMAKNPDLKDITYTAPSGSAEIHQLTCEQGLHVPAHIVYLYQNPDLTPINPTTADIAAFAVYVGKDPFVAFVTPAPVITEHRMQEALLHNACLLADCGSNGCSMQLEHEKNAARRKKK